MKLEIWTLRDTPENEHYTALGMNRMRDTMTIWLIAMRVHRKHGGASCYRITF